MFTGLTNQVSNWMGKKGEDGTELPAEEKPTTETEQTEQKDSSPTKTTSSKLEMLAGVKSQMSQVSGWLSSVPASMPSMPSMPSIPGLNRGSTVPNENDAGLPADMTSEEAQTTTVEPAAATAQENVKDDDASSATGGADSGPGSLEGTPTEDKEGQFGAVSTKALAGAKSLGGFLYSAASKAGKTVAEASAKIKKTVEENRLISDLNKEQEAFIAGNKTGKGEPVPPWVGSPNEDALKEECLALSTDRRNFVRAPPPGVDFQWDFEAVQPMAEATLAVDPNLESMRFELVPKVISEENFWRNYFYRVSLLRQSHELNAMANQQTSEGTVNPSFTSNDSVDQSQVKERVKKEISAESTLKSNNKESESNAKVNTKTNEVVDEVKEGMKTLGVQQTKAEEDWERELEIELKDFEVVPGQEKNNSEKDDWDEGQIDDLLDDDEDLK